MTDESGARDPQTGRIRRGHTLNPKGRPPKISTTDEAVLRAAQEAVTVTLNGGRRQKRTKLDVAATQIVNQAVSGNLSAGKTTIELVRRAEERRAQSSGSEELPPSDREIAERFVAKLRRILSPEPDHEPDPS